MSPISENALKAFDTLKRFSYSLTHLRFFFSWEEVGQTALVIKLRQAHDGLYFQQLSASLTHKPIVWLDAHSVLQ